MKKLRISQITGKPAKKNGAPKGNKNNEKYTLPVAVNIFNTALQLLVENPDILTETELIFKCKELLPYRSYRYLADEKFPLELADIKREICSILEGRVMRSKKMYPGIAAMTLKNKHKWKDQQDIQVGMDEATLNTILSTLPPEQAEKTKAALLALSSKKTKR